MRFSYRVRRDHRSQPNLNRTDRVIFGVLTILFTFFAFVVLPVRHFFM